MGDLDARCAGLAARQHGVISREQALRIGMSKRRIDRRLSSGAWTRVFPSVYRHEGSPPSWLQSLKAATLWAGHEAAVSHRSAAALWGLDGFPQGVVELSARNYFSTPPSGLRLHSPQRMERSERVICSGVPVTHVARTLCDLGAVASDLQVEAALECALVRQWVTLSQIERCLARNSGRGRRGASVLRAILALRPKGVAPAESAMEVRLLRALRDTGLPEPVRQFEVKLPNGATARLDFAYPLQRLSLEADGGDQHLRRPRWERDHARRNALVALGWRCLVVTWSRLINDPAKVVEEVHQALRKPIFYQSTTAAVVD